MYNAELISCALFLFWVFGTMSVLLDLDHLWKLYGYIPPINLTNWAGRPLHNPVVYFIVSGICSIIFLTFIYGLAGLLFETFRQGVWTWLLFGLNIMTYLVSWRLGAKLNERLGNEY